MSPVLAFLAGSFCSVACFGLAGAAVMIWAIREHERHVDQ